MLYKAMTNLQLHDHSVQLTFVLVTDNEVKRVQ